MYNDAYAYNKLLDKVSNFYFEVTNGRKKRGIPQRVMIELILGLNYCNN